MDWKSKSFALLKKNQKNDAMMSAAKIQKTENPEMNNMKYLYNYHNMCIQLKLIISSFFT